jgi:hypothetical protein
MGMEEETRPWGPSERTLLNGNALRAARSRTPRLVPRRSIHPHGIAAFSWPQLVAANGAVFTAATIK